MASSIIHFVVLLTWGFRLATEIPQHFSKSRRRILRGGMCIRTHLTELSVGVIWCNGTAYIEGPNWRHFCGIHRLREGEVLAFTHLGHYAYVAQILTPRTEFSQPIPVQRPLVSKFCKVIGKCGSRSSKRSGKSRLYIPAAVWRSNGFHQGNHNIAKLKYRSMQPSVVELKVYPHLDSKSGGATIALTKGWNAFCRNTGIEEGDKCTFTIIHTTYGEDKNEVLIELNSITKQTII